MNMGSIREQFSEIHVPELSIKSNVLHQIQYRKFKRKRRMQLSAVAALMIIIIGTVQFKQITAIAENLYRNIHLSLNDKTLVINDHLKSVPIEVNGLSWVGKKSNRVGSKQYENIQAAEDELKIKVLQNTLGYQSAMNREVPFLYFEKRNVAELLFNDLFVGDLKNFTETISENGDRQFSYSSDHDTLYKSPVSMRVLFFTGSGENYKADHWNIFNYEEKYISPTNGITAYLLTDSIEVSSNKEKLLLYAANSTTDKLAVFVYDNLFYTLSGNIPSDEMKHIIDSFVLK